MGHATDLVGGTWTLTRRREDREDQEEREGRGDRERVFEFRDKI